MKGAWAGRNAIEIRVSIGSFLLHKRDIHCRLVRDRLRCRCSGCFFFFFFFVVFFFLC
jgi:hypothetical protein